jgi:hypothetical protein
MLYSEYHSNLIKAPRSALFSTGILCGDIKGYFAVPFYHLTML